MKAPRGKPFPKGNSGRIKGTPNKLTRTVKETVLSVFNELQADPKAKLIAWAKDEPTEFYKIAAKLIPTELTGAIDNNVILTIVRGKPNTK